MNVNQLLWFAVTISLLPNLSADKICTGKKADIIFIIDSSSSMGDEKFLKVQASIKGFAGKLELGPGKSQLGFVQYSTFGLYKQEVQLQADRSEADNIKAIDELKFGKGGFTSLPSGVCMATLQTTRPDADVKKIYVIVSRGETNRDELEFPKGCRNYGDKSEVFATAKQQADAIVAINLQVSKPDTENLNALTTKIFDSDLNGGLDSLLENQIKKILDCNPPPKIFSIRKYDDCVPKKDVVFIIDSSSSMGEVAFNKTRCAIKAFADGLKLGPEKIQLGFAQYGMYAKPDQAVDLDGSRSEADNKAKIHSLYFGSGGCTNLPNGVCLANTFKFRGNGVPVHYIIVSRGETNKDRLMKPCKGADIEQTLADTKNSGKIISAISLSFINNDSVTIGKLIKDQKEYYKDVSEDAIEVVLDSIGFHHRF